jgi:glycosyltransferase involved in cell wall biosynthesis
VDDVVAVLPFLKGSREDWLRQAIGSLPLGMRYLVAENEGELSQAFNEAIEAAEAPYVLITGADDAWTPGAVALLREAIELCDVAYPSVVLSSEENLSSLGTLEAAPFSQARLERWNFIPGCALVRRDAVLSVGGFRDLEALEDWDLWVRMARNGFRFTPVPKAYYLYRQVANSRNKVSLERDEWREKVAPDSQEPVATFYHQDGPGTVYWRCQVPGKHLPAVVTRFPEISFSGDPYPEHVGTAVWQAPRTLEQLTIARDLHLDYPMFVEVDDDYLNRPNQTDRKLDRYAKAAHEVLCEEADGILCATEELARRYSKLNRNVHVCPNVIDPEDWPEPEPGKKLRVGFAGGSAHEDDMRLVLPALRWASQQPDVEVVIIGLFKRLGSYTGPLVIPKGFDFDFTYVEWSDDLRRYRKSLGLLDIGLAPLLDGEWNRAKSDLKILEYSMVGAASIVSDVEPYRGWDVPKCRSADDFLRTVKSLVLEPEKREELAQTTRERVLSERTVRNERWSEALAPIGVR